MHRILSDIKVVLVLVLVIVIDFSTRVFDSEDEDE
jgi:hypothetical protein